MENFTLNSKRIKSIVGTFLVPIGVIAITLTVALLTERFFLLAWCAVILALIGGGVTTLLVVYNYKVSIYQTQNIANFVVYANNKIKTFLGLLVTNHIIRLLALLLCFFPLYYLNIQLFIFLSIGVFFKIFDTYQFIKWFNFLNNDHMQEPSTELSAIRITREHAPELWSKLENIAKVLKISIPNNVLIGIEEGIWVDQQANFILKGSDLPITGSVLYFSVMSLAIHSLDEIALICAHEFGHLKIIEDIENKSVNTHLLSIYQKLIYEIANNESFSNYYFEPSTALCRSFTEFLDRLYTSIEIAADNYSLCTNEKVKVAVTLLYHTSFQPHWSAIIEDFKAGKVSSKQSLLSEIYQRFDKEMCANALQTFNQYPNFHEKTFKKRISALTSKQTILEPPIPIINYQNSCIKYIDLEKITIIESLFLNRIKTHQQEAIETLQEMSNYSSAKKKETFRYSGQIVGFFIILLAMIPISLLPEEASLSMTIFLVLIIITLLLSGGYLIIKSWQTYLTITPQGLIIPLVKGEVCITWQEIDNLSFDEKTMKLIFSKWIINNPQQLKANWHLSDDGYCLSFYSSALTEKKMRTIFNYYAAVRARKELAHMKKNGWLE